MAAVAHERVLIADTGETHLESSWLSCARPKTDKCVRVTTARGTFVGQKLKEVIAFKGVPYASCRRFGLPERIETYGELDCTSHGPMAPQPELASAMGAFSLLFRQKMHVASKLPGTMDEDKCLNLQMYLPHVHKDEKPLPVFVFIHGGLFLFGSNQQSIFQSKSGCKLAHKQQIAVVLVNYRLGPFGFLKVPGGETNLGVRDVVAALQWIQEEGRAFGLDTGNVTIAGQSAGAMLTGALLHVPAAQGLFRRVAMLSGSTKNIMSAADADIQGQRLACSVDVHTASASELLGAAIDMLSGDGVMPFQPCVDGSFLLKHTCASGLDILTGVTENEAETFMPRLPFSTASLEEATDALTAVLGPQQMDCNTTQAERVEVMEAVQESYNEHASSDMYRRLLSGVVFESPLLMSLRELKDANNVYVYRNALGPGHGGDLGFVFGTWNANTVYRFMSGLSMWNRSANSTQGRAMESLWGKILNSFVRRGIPPGDWPQYNELNLAMSLSPEGMTQVPATAKAVECLSTLISRHKRPYGLVIPQATSKL